MPGSAWRRRLMSAHLSNASCPHRELKLRPTYQSPHGVAASCGYIPHSSRGPIGRSSEGPPTRVRMASPPH
eukprot:7782016-Pyramimonas_sp.AAC.1